MRDAARDRRTVLVATLACVAAAFCWGLNAIVAAGAFERGVSPERLAQARVVVAFVPLAAWLVLTRRHLLRPPSGTLGVLIAFGTCIVVVNFAYYLAIARVPVGVAISLQYTAPVLVLVGVALAWRQLPPPLVWLAAGLTLLGAVLVSGALGGADEVDPIGLAAGVASALSFAGYLVTAEIAGRRGTHPTTSLVIGFAVAVAIWAIILPPWGWPFALLADPQIAWRVLAVGLVGTLLPFFLAVTALRIISASVAGIAATTEPVFAAGLAWVILGQDLAAPQLLGGAAVVSGVIVAQLTSPPAPAAAPVEVAP